MTTTTWASAAISLLRSGKRHLSGAVPGAASGDYAPGDLNTGPQAATACGVDHVDSPTDHRDRSRQVARAPALPREPPRRCLRPGRKRRPHRRPTSSPRAQKRQHIRSASPTWCPTRATQGWSSWAMDPRTNSTSGAARSSMRRDGYPGDPRRKAAVFEDANRSRGRNSHTGGRI